MFDSHVALEALGALLNAEVTSHQKLGSLRQARPPRAGRAQHEPLSIPHFITKLFQAHEASQVLESNFLGIPSISPSCHVPPKPRVDLEDVITGKCHIIDEEEFFDPKYNYDFTNIKDTKTFYRGGEKYERPCGWQRYALKVLDKYEDGNTWLGTRYRSTGSEPGEWPVSYHGTSKPGAEGIIEGGYEPGPRAMFGRGIYSTPLMSVASEYTFQKKFTSKKTGKTYEVILQNRINPKYREKHNNDKYWLIPIPAGTSPSQEQVMVDRSIRPYGLLLKEV
ncbi:hypothetical protein Q5P01_000503 [Channa striata]|uniref:Uncharacterized protein n=1 Tax=Channa striata TaxID=64152 RepID=A0AA88IIT3_CHASR|nr:hypothetical protein Q5P01_000503 [Channa striata]